MPYPKGIKRESLIIQLYSFPISEKRQVRLYLERTKGGALTCHLATFILWSGSWSEGTQRIRFPANIKTLESMAGLLDHTANFIRDKRLFAKPAEELPPDWVCEIQDGLERLVRDGEMNLDDE